MPIRLSHSDLVIPAAVRHVPAHYSLPSGVTTFLGAKDLPRDLLCPYSPETLRKRAMAQAGLPIPVDIEKAVRAQYRLQIYLIVLANSAFLYGVAKANALSIEGLRGLFSGWHDLIPVGFAALIATVVNGVFSDEAKNRLVFLKWHYPLPGHRAFSFYAKTDPRISVADVEALCGGSIPVGPAEENSRWYRFYVSMKGEETVAQANRNFMLTRDYTGLSILFLLVYGPIGIYVIHSSRTAALYLTVLLVQYLIVRQAACNYGIALVRRVLARAAVTHFPSVQ